MNVRELHRKINKYYQRGGISAVTDKIKEVLRSDIYLIPSKVWWKVHFESLPDPTSNAVSQWKVYAFLKHKYRTVLRAANNYLEDYQNVHKPTPKIIWWCWLQGEEQAPPLCKACLKSLQQNYPDYDIRVVTSANLHDYVHMPEYIEAKYKAGKIKAAHYSDILRTLLLIEYGGAWIDSTVFSSKRAEDLLTEPLFFYQTFMREDRSIIGSNWLIVACPQNPVLLLTRIFCSNIGKRIIMLYIISFSIFSSIWQQNNTGKFGIRFRCIPMFQCISCRKNFLNHIRKNASNRLPVWRISIN